MVRTPRQQTAGNPRCHHRHRRLLRRTRSGRGYCPGLGAPRSWCPGPLDYTRQILRPRSEQFSPVFFWGGGVVENWDFVFADVCGVIRERHPGYTLQMDGCCTSQNCDDLVDHL